MGLCAVRPGSSLALSCLVQGSQVHEGNLEHVFPSLLKTQVLRAAHVAQWLGTLM